MEDDEETARRQHEAALDDVGETVDGAVSSENAVEATLSVAGTTEATALQSHAAADAVDEREVLFLIANYLEKRSESKQAAQALIKDLSSGELLGESISWTGQPKNLTYADYKRRHRDLGPDHLLHILKGALTAKTAASVEPGSVLKTSNSLLLKSRVASQRKPLTPAERKAMQTEIIDKTVQLRKLQRTEALVTRIVSKYDRLLQFLEDAKLESLPWDVRNALDDATNSNASVNVTALAADVRAVRQLIEVREEKATLQEKLYRLLEQAKEVGATQATARRGRNHLSLLHRREISSRATPQLPPSHIYSRIRRLKTLNGHLQIPAYCMTYDKTGKLVITGADDRLIKIWSLQTGDLRFSLRGHVGNITDLAVNQSNTLLASSSDDKTVRVWELSTGAPVAVLLGHSSVVNSVRFHPEKNIVVTASDDGHCFCYKLPDVAKFDEPESKQQTAKRLLDQAAYLLTLRPAFSLSHAPNKPNVRSNKVLCLNFSRCGNFVVTGGQDGLGRVWDVSDLSNADGQVAATDFRVAQEAPAVALPAADDAVPEPQVGLLPHAAVPGAQDDLPFPVELARAIQPDVQINVEGMLGMMQVPVAGPANDQLPVGPLVDALPLLAPPAVQLQEPLLPGALALPEQQPLLQIPLLDQIAANEGEQRQQPQLAEVQQARQVVVDIDQVKTVTEPIAYLKGHTGPVTNILFSHQGHRIATASIKDGTTRVWQWEKKYRKVTHKVLVSDERDRERELALLYGVASRKKTPPAVDTLVWTHDDKRLITLHSTKPDSGTGEGDWKQRMRVWNPMTGSLELTLAAVDREKKKGHVNAVFAMDVHPSDWRIVVTAGHDGRVFIWDILEGKILKSFVVTSPEGETVALLDGSFMPTGDGFCFTDRIGRLCIFGTGSGENYAAVPVQQYFYSDYAALVTDRHFHVIDRETQVNPSLMESGPLTDIFRINYPVQPPHLLASQGALTPEQYEENRRKRVEQCIESETICKVRHVDEDKALADDDDFPVAILQPPAPLSVAADASTSAPLLASGSYRLNGDPVLHAEMMRRASWNRRQRGELRARRRASPTVDDRDTSILNLEISSEDDRSDEDFQVPTNRRAGDEDDEEDDDEDDDDEEEEEDDDDMLSDASDAPEGARLRRRRARQTERQLPGRGRRLGGEDADDDDDDDEAPGVRLRRRRAAARSRLVDDEDDEVADGVGEAGLSRADRAERRLRSRSRSAETLDSVADGGDGVVVESNDGFIMGDNQLDRFDTTTTYFEMLQVKLDQLAATGGGPPEGALIVCALCSEGDDQGMLKLPGDAMGVHPLISASQRLFVHDQCAIASPLCFNRGGRWYNVTKEIRRGRSLVCVQCKKRGATIGCTIERCPKSYHWKCAVACGWSMNQIHFYCPEHVQRSSSGVAQGSNGVDREMQHRFGLTFHREWLQLSSLVGVHPYVPQTGDNVVYFPGGHVDFLRFTTIKEPAYLRQVARFVTLKCRVIGVKYLFPSLAEYNHGDDGQKAIQCEVSLAILAVPSTAFPSLTRDQEEKEEKEESDGAGLPHADALFVPDAPYFSRFVGVNQYLQPVTEAECERFTIKVRMFSNDVSNFIVLDHAFEAGISGDWKIGQRVRAPYMELNHGLQVSSKMSFGTITNINVRPSLANPAVITPWNSLFVQWDADDEDDCDVSPWELEPATAAETAVKRLRERELVAVKLLKSRKLSHLEQQAVVEALSSVMGLDIAKDFVHPVGSEYADYMVTVANPIDLLKIRARVENGYYRQLEAFVADIELLNENCETYNVSTSPIAQNSRSIVAAIFASLQQHFPDFLANRTQRRGSSVLPFPLMDFGSNEDEDDVVEADESEYEVEGARPARLAAVAEPSVAAEIPQVASPAPSRPTRSTRASAVEAAQTEEPTPPSPSPLSPPRRTRQAAPTTVAATPERRMKREAPVLSSPEPTRGRKRQRPTGDRIMKFPDVVGFLTPDQRHVLEERMTDDLLSLLRDFHEALMGADTGEIFASPVTDDIAPGYSDVILSPMDFGTILDMIERYSSFPDYFADLELVFSNAITYNSWNSDIGELVKELQGYYVKFLLDAIGATAKTKAKPRGGARQTVHLHAGTPSPSRAKPATQSKRKRRAISDEDDDEDSFGGSSSSSSASSSDDDHDEEAEDDSSADEELSESQSEPESDSSGGRPRRRRLSQRTAKKPAGKKNKGGKKTKKTATKNKRSRR